MHDGVNARLRPIGGVFLESQDTTPSTFFIPELTRAIAIEADAAIFYQVNKSRTAPSVATTNGKTTIATHGTPTGGTFRLTVFPGTVLEEETSALTYNESAGDVESALLALGAFASGDTDDSGGALPTAIVIEWKGAYAGLVPPIIPSSVALTGGTNPSVRVYTSTKPVLNGGYGITGGTPEPLIVSKDVRGAFDRYLHLAAVAGEAPADISITYLG